MQIGARAPKWYKCLILGANIAETLCPKRPKLPEQLALMAFMIYHTDIIELI